MNPFGTQRVADEQLRLEELELEHKCCICESELKTRRVTEHESGFLSQHFGKKVRGFLCEICLSIAGIGKKSSSTTSSSGSDATQQDANKMHLAIELKNAAASVFCFSCKNRRATVIQLDVPALLCSTCGGEDSPSCVPLSSKFTPAEQSKVQKAIKLKNKNSTNSSSSSTGSSSSTAAAATTPTTITNTSTVQQQQQIISPSTAAQATTSKPQANALDDFFAAAPTNTSAAPTLSAFSTTPNDMFAQPAASWDSAFSTTTNSTQNNSTAAAKNNSNSTNNTNDFFSSSFTNTNAVPPSTNYSTPNAAPAVRFDAEPTFGFSPPKLPTPQAPPVIQTLNKQIIPQNPNANKAKDDIFASLF